MADDARPGRGERGGALVLIRLLATGTEGAGAYGAGQYAAGAFGLIMVVAGVRALLKTRES